MEVISVDIPYGDDPVGTIRKIVEQYGDVIAVAPTAPFHVLMKLVDGLGKDVTILREEFKRSADGRVLVIGKDGNGRNLLSYDRGVRLTRIIFQTCELI